MNAPAAASVSGAIYGIGTDIIQIERVEGVMQRTNGCLLYTSDAADDP